MPGNIEYITWDLSRLADLKQEYSRPLQLKSGGFMLCLEGYCDVVVDTKQYHISQRDMIISMPYSVVHILNASNDCRCIIIGASIDFFAQVQISNKSYYFTNIREHPSISLNQQEVDKILTLSQMLTNERQNKNHKFRAEINEAILNIILYETADIYSKRKPNTEQNNSRDNIIFNNFIFEVFRDYKTQRELSYYAHNQHITPGHLSKVIKRTSGRTASEWLVDCVIMNIKVSLLDKSISISSIAEEFNFANNSFFSQYFKKYTGMTPRQYRDDASYINNVDED